MGFMVTDDEFGGFGEDDEFSGFGEDDKIATLPATESEPKTETKVEQKPEKKARKKPTRGKKAKPKDQAKLKLTPQEKFVNKILKRTGRHELPELDSLFEGRKGSKMSIKDIAIFLSDKPDDELLDELTSKLKLRNTINLSAEVDAKRVRDVAQQLIESGRMFMTIEVAQLTDGSKQVECWSGRHRIAALALLYGTDIEIPVQVCEMSTVMARDAVVYANQSRKAKGLEKSEHSVLRESGGKTDDERDEMYAKVVTKKMKAIDFAVFSSISQGVKGMNLKFAVSESASRKNGELTTVNNVRCYFRSILVDWTKNTNRAEYDRDLRSGIAFLNALTEEMKKHEDFVPKQHLSGQAMVALGQMHVRLGVVIGSENKTTVDYAPVVAESIIELGEIGRNKSGDIYRSMKDLVTKKLKKAK